METLLLMTFPCARKLGNICVGNNVSETMCPRLPVPLDAANDFNENQDF